LNVFSLAVTLAPRNNPRGGQNHLQQLLRPWIHHLDARWHARGVIQSAAPAFQNWLVSNSRDPSSPSAKAEREAILAMKRHARTDRA
jgi:hypothetical protein